MRVTSFLTVLAIGLVLWSVSCSVSALDSKHPATGEPLEAQSLRAVEPLIIDGKLDEWKSVVPVEIEYEEQIARWPENWTGAEDGSARIYSMWDDSFVYVAAEVTDDILGAVEAAGVGIWTNDCLEVFFGPENATAVASDDDLHTTHYQFGLSPAGPGGVPQNYCWCNPDGNAKQQPDYITVASVIPNPYTGYTLEASISLDSVPKLAARVVEGVTISYHLTLDDRDAQEPIGTQLTWSGSNAHNDASFGNITFVGPLKAVISPQSKVATVWGALK